MQQWLFHLLVVSPVQVEAHKAPAVLLESHYVQALSMSGALEALGGLVLNDAVAEVWGGVFDVGHIKPSAPMREQIGVGDFMNWCIHQEGYRLVYSGPQSLTQYRDAAVAQFMARLIPAKG